MDTMVGRPATWSEKLAAVDEMLGDGLPFGVVEDWIESLYAPEDEKAALFLRAASVDRESQPLHDELWDKRAAGSLRAVVARLLM